MKTLFSLNKLTNASLRYFDKHGAALSNRFDDISEYFVKCAVIQAIAQAIHPISFPVYGYDSKFSLNLVSFEMTSIQESLPHDVLQLVLSFLEQNDTISHFDDCFYLHNLIITCAICALYAKDQITRHRVYKQLFRYLKREETMPSYHHVITGASLKGLTILQLGGFLRIPNQWDPILVSDTEGLVSNERESNEWEKALWKSFRTSGNPFLTKIAMECLFHLYKGHIEFLEWLLEAWIENGRERYEPIRKSAIRLLQRQVALRPSLRNRLRKHDQQSIQFCLRWLRWILEEKNCVLQLEGWKVAKQIWGSYIPLCLLTNEEYERERNERKKSYKERKELDYRLEGRKMVVLPAKEQSSSLTSHPPEQQESGMENVPDRQESMTIKNEPVTQEGHVEEWSWYFVKEVMERIKTTCSLDDEDEHYMRSFLEQGCQGSNANSVGVALNKFGLKQLIARCQQQKHPEEFRIPEELDR